MILASTSRVQLSYIPELVFGETPAVGTPKELRMLGETFNFTLNKESSEEINADRAVSSMIPVSAEASGAVNYELSFGEYDPLMEATLQGTWAPFGASGVGVAFEATFDIDEITASSATIGPSNMANLQRGQWFVVSGTGTANDGRLFRVSKDVAPTTTVLTLDPSTPAVPGGPYMSTVIRASRLSNGVTQRSFTFQRSIDDVGEYFSFRGMTASSMSLAIAQSARTTGDFNFMGRDSEQDNMSLLPGVPTPSQAFQIMSGVSGTVCALWVGGVPLEDTFISSLNLSFDNALRMQNALCSLGAVGIGSGTIAATADIEVYFSSGATFYREFLNNENLEISFTSFDPEGNGYIFTFPKANVSTYELTAGSKDQDLMATISLTGLLDKGNAIPSLRKVLFIDRVGAPLVV